MGRITSLLGPPLQKMRVWYNASSNLMWLVVVYPFAYFAAYVLGYYFYARSYVSDALMISIFDHVFMLKSTLIVHHDHFGQNEAGRVATTFLLYAFVAICGGVWAAICGATEHSRFIKNQPDVSWVSIPLALLVVLGLMMFMTGDNIGGECIGRGSCFWRQWPFELAFFTAPIFFGPYFMTIYLRFRE